MDDRDLIRRFLGEPVVDGATRSRARAELDRSLVRGVRPPRRWALVAAGVAAMLVGSLIWSASRSPSAAAEALDALAALPTTGLDLGPDDYLYRASEELNLTVAETIGSEEVRAHVRMSTEQWLRVDGYGERRSFIQAVTYPTSADEHGWTQLGPPLVGSTVRTRFTAGQSLLVDPDDIPTDPEVLVSALRNGSIRSTGGDDAGVFELIGELLAQGNLPATTRSALLEAAAELDGVRLLGSAADPLGREGEVFSVRTPNSEIRLVFEPRSGALLAIERLEPSPDDSWELVDWQAFLSADIVGRIPPWPEQGPAG